MVNNNHLQIWTDIHFNDFGKKKKKEKTEKKKEK